jgi:hypothetical protein
MTKMNRKNLRALIQEAMGQIDVSTLSGDDVLFAKEPQYDTGLRSPEKRLLDKLAVRGVLDQMSPEDLEALAGGDPEVMALILDIQNNAMLDNPGFRR